MSQNSGDLRVRRTQKLLREALIALIEERSFDAITVGEIAERAMVSRAAFYRYYQDKYDLVEKIFEEMIAIVVHDIEPYRRDIVRRFNECPASDAWEIIFEQVANDLPVHLSWVKMFEHFAQYEHLYRALLGKNGSSWFANRMREYVTRTISERILALAHALNSKRITESHAVAGGLVPALIAGQLLDAIIWWLEQGKPYTPDQMARYSYRLMCSTLKEGSSWD